MIAPVSSCTRNSYKRFEGAREEGCRAMAGVTAVPAPPAQGSAIGTLEQAGSRRVRTPAPKGHNPRSDRARIFTGASGVRFPYSSNGSATHIAGSLDLDVLTPEPWAFLYCYHHNNVPERLHYKKKHMQFWL